MPDITLQKPSTATPNFDELQLSSRWKEKHEDSTTTIILKDHEQEPYNHFLDQNINLILAKESSPIDSYTKLLDLFYQKIQLFHQCTNNKTLDEETESKEIKKITQLAERITYKIIYINDEAIRNGDGINFKLKSNELFALLYVAKSNTRATQVFENIFGLDIQDKTIASTADSTMYNNGIVNLLATQTKITHFRGTWKKIFEENQEDRRSNYSEFEDQEAITNSCRELLGNISEILSNGNWNLDDQVTKILMAAISRLDHQGDYKTTEAVHYDYYDQDILAEIKSMLAAGLADNNGNLKDSCVSVIHAYIEDLNTNVHNPPTAEFAQLNFLEALTAGLLETVMDYGINTNTDDNLGSKINRLFRGLSEHNIKVYIKNTIVNNFEWSKIIGDKGSLIATLGMFESRMLSLDEDDQEDAKKHCVSFVKEKMSVDGLINASLTALLGSFVVNEEEKGKVQRGVFSNLGAIDDAVDSLLLDSEGNLLSINRKDELKNSYKNQLVSRCYESLTLMNGNQQDVPEQFLDSTKTDKINNAKNITEIQEAIQSLMANNSNETIITPFAVPNVKISYNKVNKKPNSVNVATIQISNGGSYINESDIRIETKKSSQGASTFSHISRTKTDSNDTVVEIKVARSLHSENDIQNKITFTEQVMQSKAKKVVLNLFNPTTGFAQPTIEDNSSTFFFSSPSNAPNDLLGVGGFDINKAPAKNAFNQQITVSTAEVNLFISVMRKLIIDNIDAETEKDKSKMNAGYSQWRNQIANILKKEDKFEVLNEYDFGRPFQKFDNKYIVGDGVIPDPKQIRQVDAIESMINKFDYISAKMQKTAATLFDTIEGKKYADPSNGARSFRIIQMLPKDYTLSNEQGITI
jgi:hypothetical protein